MLNNGSIEYYHMDKKGILHWVLQIMGITEKV